jgi:hypothetical protein
MSALTLQSIAARVSQIEEALQRFGLTPSTIRDPNRQAYERMKADLLRQYPGEYAAFVEGKLVGHHADRQQLLDALYEQHPGQRIFYKRLSEPEPVHSLPSPQHA